MVISVPAESVVFVDDDGGEVFFLVSWLLLLFVEIMAFHRFWQISRHLYIRGQGCSPFAGSNFGFLQVGRG